MQLWKEHEYLLRLVSTQDNFPQEGNGLESFLCLVSPVRSCPEESFPKWKPAFGGRMLGKIDRLPSYDRHQGHNGDINRADIN